MQKNNIKTKHFEAINKEIQVLVEELIKQFSLLDRFLKEKTIDNVFFEEGIEREEHINKLEKQIFNDVVNSVLLFTPRAADLRNIVSTHEVIMNIERIANLLLTSAEDLQKSDLKNSKFDKIQIHLLQMLNLEREMLSEATLAFIQRDSAVSYRAISKNDISTAYLVKLQAELIAMGQDGGLSEQEFTNIIIYSKIGQVLAMIGDYGVGIAESTVFLVEGKNIRNIHKDNE